MIDNVRRQIAVPLNDLPWEVVADGARHKSMEIEGKRVRVLELTHVFVEHDWCTKGHVGYVLEGDLEIIREAAVERIAQGNGFCLQAGTADRHKARSVGQKVVLLLLEDADLGSAPLKNRRDNQS